jgi:hypothetical protein
MQNAYSLLTSKVKEIFENSRFNEYMERKWNQESL